MKNPIKRWFLFFLTALPLFGQAPAAPDSAAIRADRLIETSFRNLEEAPSKSLAFGREALALSAASGDSLRSAAACDAMSAAFLRLREADSALAYDRQALTLGGRRAGPALRVSILTHLASCHLQRKESDRAADFMKQALSEAESSADQALLVETLKSAASIAASRSDFRSAFGYQLRHAALWDSVRSEAERTRLSDIEARGRIERSTLEARLAAAENSVRLRPDFVRFLIAAVTAFLFASAFVTAVLVARSREQRLRHRLENTEARLLASTRMNESVQESVVRELKPLLETAAGPAGKDTASAGRDTRVAAGRALDRAQDIIDVPSLRDKRRTTAEETVSLHETAEKGFASLQKLFAERGIRAHNDVVRNLDVIGDPDWIRRVFSTLLARMAEITPSGGEVWAKAISGEDEWVRASVNGTSDGLPPGDRAGMFGAERTGEGTALDLAFCRLAVEAHGGTIKVESDGGGLSFGFTLPRADTPSAAAVAERAAEVLKAAIPKPVALSDADRRRLRATLESLRSLTVKKKADIMNIIESMTDKSPRVQRWKEAVEKAVQEGNAAEYKRLCG
jgi:signal transduction histidine kinase